MSDFRRCPLCKEYGWLNDASFLRHVCKPAFECRPEWYGEDEDAWEMVHARDTEEAAEKFAERYDCEGGDYAIVSGKMRNDVVIQVRKPDGDEIERWSITAETVPTYYARKVEVSPSPQGNEVPHE